MVPGLRASRMVHRPIATGPGVTAGPRIQPISSGWGRWGRTGAVLAVLTLVLTGCSGGSEDAFVGTASTATTATTVAATAPPTTTGATVPGPTNTTAAPTTTQPRSPTVPLPTATTRPPRATTSTAPAPVACSSLLLAVEAASLQPTYRAGETVRIQATLRNKSNVPCRYTSYGISNRIDNAAGQPVRPAPVLVIDAPEESVLEPGQTLGAAPTWDQQICSGTAAPCTQAPPGRYRARATWVFAGAPVEGVANFELVP